MQINLKLQFRFWPPFDHFWAVKTARLTGRLKPGRFKPFNPDRIWKRTRHLQLKKFAN